MNSKPSSIQYNHDVGGIKAAILHLPLFFALLSLARHFRAKGGLVRQGDYLLLLLGFRVRCGVVLINADDGRSPLSLPPPV